MTRYKTGIAVMLFAFSLMLSPHIAQAFDARDYMSAPPGTDFVIWYYKNISAVQYYSDNKRIDDIDVHANIGMLRMVHYMNFPGTSVIIDPQFILPFGYQFADGLKGSSGLGDLILACTTWLISDPASQTYLGFCPWLFIPTGDYDSGRALNLGTNRWALRGELGLTKGFGPWWLDLGGSVEGYTNNNRYGSDNQTLKQDPVFRLEAHVTYDINKSLYMGLEYFFVTGGEKQVNDGEKFDQIQSHSLQVCTGFWFSPQYQLLATYKLGLDEKNGPKANELGFRFMYLW